MRRHLVPTLGVLAVIEIHHPPVGRLVALIRLALAVVNRELLEIGQDAQRQARRPGVAPQLVGRADVVLQVDRRLLGLDEKLAHSPDAESVIRRLDRLAHADGILVDHVFIRFGVTLAVVHVPAQRLEERIEKLQPELRLVILGRAISVTVALEALDQFQNDVGCRHRSARVLSFKKGDGPFPSPWQPGSIDHQTMPA